MGYHVIDGDGVRSMLLTLRGSSLRKGACPDPVVKRHLECGLER